MWRRVLGALVGAILLLIAAPPVRALGEADLFGPFDARAMSPSDMRLMQTALAAQGYYHGPVDGVWGAGSQTAFDNYSEAEFESAPLNLHAASLYLEFLDEIAVNGWTQQYLRQLGLSIALPMAQLRGPEAAENTLRWRSPGGLKITATRQSGADSALWHSAGVLGNARPDDFYSLRRPARRVTAGAFDDGQSFYLRSDWIADMWSTILIVAPESEANLLNLASASISEGAPQDWGNADRGRLDELAVLTLALVGVAPPEPVPPDAASIVSPAAESLRSGTGFYVAPDLVVTAQHVVDGCAAVTLVDGTPLVLVARDAVVDLAVLRAPLAADAWLAPDLSASPLLGQRVFALGFPYFSLTGTTLNVTGGNVSALAGFQDDRRFVTVSAPVQPGNSGGPLLSAHGGVLGVIVSRLNDDYIAAETGTMPQNVNYAVSNTELVAFLRRSGAAPIVRGLSGFSLDEGAPAGIERAVVPLVCE